MIHRQHRHIRRYISSCRCIGWALPVCMWREQAISVHDVWSLLLLAATVWRFPRYLLGHSDCNSAIPFQSPPKQSSNPLQIETWNTTNKLRFYQFLGVSNPNAETQSPPIEYFLATVLSHSQVFSYNSMFSAATATIVFLWKLAYGVSDDFIYSHLLNLKVLWEKLQQKFPSLLLLTRFVSLLFGLIYKCGMYPTANWQKMTSSLVLQCSYSVIILDQGYIAY